MGRKGQVYNKLHGVFDPELDQSLTDLGFIDGIKIKENDVEVIFRLPTYWCSPNFAYIMAEDIIKAVSKLDWVAQVKVNLIDHCASAEINHGATNRKRFSESFKDESDGDLEELRRTFRMKAYYARQEQFIKQLLHEGLSKEQITTFTIEQIKAWPLSEKGLETMKRYFEKKREFDHSSILAMTTPEGTAITIDQFDDYLLNLRRTRMSMEFNAHYCRGLLEARYQLTKKEEA